MRQTSHCFVIRSSKLSTSNVKCVVALPFCFCILQHTCVLVHVIILHEVKCLYISFLLSSEKRSFGQILELFLPNKMEVKALLRLYRNYYIFQKMAYNLCNNTYVITTDSIVTLLAFRSCRTLRSLGSLRALSSHVALVSLW